MSSRRLKLHDILCKILECPNEGFDCRVYFQPPTSVKMKYPLLCMGEMILRMPMQITGFIYLK